MIQGFHKKNYKEKPTVYWIIKKQTTIYYTSYYQLVFPRSKKYNMAKILEYKQWLLSIIWTNKIDITFTIYIYIYAGIQSTKLQ